MLILMTMIMYLSESMALYAYLLIEKRDNNIIDIMLI